MRELLPGRNIVLVGLMGVGKSTIGRLLAGRLGRRFVDTDDVVEQEATATIPQIWAAHGERGFRDREAAAVRKVAALRGQVVAVGGGAVLDPRNVTHLRATGDLVWLDADAAELAQRLAAEHTHRPLLAGEPDLFLRLTALHGLRDPVYGQVAALRHDTTGWDPEQVADDLLCWAAARPGLLTAVEREA